MFKLQAIDQNFYISFFDYKHTSHYAHMYFNIFLVSFCKFCDNVRCVGKLNDGIHVNQMKTFGIVTIYPNQYGITYTSTTLNPIYPQ
jgi:hypothetical protein